MEQHIQVLAGQIMLTVNNRADGTIIRMAMSEMIFDFGCISEINHLLVGHNKYSKFSIFSTNAIILTMLYFPIFYKIKLINTNVNIVDQLISVFFI